jgi:hypothetical protein
LEALVRGIPGTVPVKSEKKLQQIRGIEKKGTSAVQFAWYQMGDGYFTEIVLQFFSV